MCCGGGTYKRSRNTGRGVAVPRQQFRRTGKYARFVKQGNVPMEKHPEIQALPTDLKAVEVTPPAIGEINPATGITVSVIKTGRDPTNTFNPLPRAVHVVDANKESGGEG